MKLNQHTCARCDGTGSVYDRMSTGAALRRMREYAGLTLRQMARRMGVSPTYLSELEMGKKRWTNARVEQFLSEWAKVSR